MAARCFSSSLFFVLFSSVVLYFFIFNDCVGDSRGNYVEPFKFYGVSKLVGARCGRPRIARPIVVWYKHGRLCLSLPSVFDLAIDMDVERNPGPAFHCNSVSRYRITQDQAARTDLSISSTSSSLSSFASSVTLSNWNYRSLQVMLHVGHPNALGTKYCVRRFGNSFWPRYRGNRTRRRVQERRRNCRFNLPTIVSHLHSYRCVTPLHQGASYANPRCVDNLIYIACTPRNFWKKPHLADLCLRNARSVKNKTLAIKDFVVENDIDIARNLA